MNKDEIELKAEEIASWIQDAVGDMAYDLERTGFQTDFTMDEEWGPRIKKAKKSGVTDLPGWLADELYNDKDTLRDLTGDRICDAAIGKGKKQWQAMILIANKMKERSHPELTKALNEHIKDWERVAGINEAELLAEGYTADMEA